MIAIRKAPLALWRYVVAAALSGFGCAASADTNIHLDLNNPTLAVIDASARINNAGKLRMLTQRIAAAACNLHAGIAPEESRIAMLSAKDQFETLLAALTDGASEFGIVGPEQNPGLRRQINALGGLWAPFRDTAASLLSNPTDINSLTGLVDQSETILRETSELVPSIAGRYTQTSQLTMSYALMIDVAGRQRMLAQRVAKNACLVGQAVNLPFAKAELDAASENFKTSLAALTHGMQAAGISPPPNDDIASALALVAEDWSTLEALVAVTETPNDDVQIFEQASAVMAKMDSIVARYSEASIGLR